MNIKYNLNSIGLTAYNAIVIGSGILNALGLRESKDIDVVVKPETYMQLSQDSRFAKEQNHDREILTDDLFEISTSWGVLGEDQTFDDLRRESTVIDEIRYITPEFLLKAKKNWLHEGGVRQKDFDDVVLIEEYLDERKSGHKS